MVGHKTLSKHRWHTDKNMTDAENTIKNPNIRQSLDSVWICSSLYFCLHHRFDEPKLCVIILNEHSVCVRSYWQVRHCPQVRQWWARCLCSRPTSGGRCSCTSPGRCEPSGQWPRYQASPGFGWCSKAGSAACSLCPAGSGSLPHWSAVDRWHGKSDFFFKLNRQHVC